MGIYLNRVVIVEIVLPVFIVLVLFRISTSEDTPPNFEFGDSLVDVGQQLGFGFTPPYLAPTIVRPVVLKGVNYASGGGGILNLTGQVFGGRVNFDAQIDNFANTRQYIISSIGIPASLNLLKKALFSVTIGSNDFINKYLTPAVIINEQKLASPEISVTTMISKLRTQLTRLFNLGARKIVVENVGPIGFIPSQRDGNPAAGENCVTFPNHLAQLFNTQLKGLIVELSSNLNGSMFVYEDVYHILQDMLQNYKAFASHQEGPHLQRCHKVAYHYIYSRKTCQSITFAY